MRYVTSSIDKKDEESLNFFRLLVRTYCTCGCDCMVADRELDVGPQIETDEFVQLFSSPAFADHRSTFLRYCLNQMIAMALNGNAIDKFTLGCMVRRRRMTVAVLLVTTVFAYGNRSALLIFATKTCFGTECLVNHVTQV